MDQESSSRPTRTSRTAVGDPRLYQIAVLSGLLAYGILVLDLEVDPLVALVVLGSALAAQYLCAELLGLRVDYRSPLISGLSLCLLLRTSSLAVAVLAATVAIASKFLIRRRGKHIFNPSALGLVAVILLSDRAWVSAGQWGSMAFFAFLVASLGMLVVRRAERSDVTFAFLLAWTALVLARALWLGDPLAIPIHQLQSGALLLFAFFMISDPRTTPDSRAGRILFACLVALGAGVVQFGLYRANGPLYALVACSILVPWIDRLLPADRYRWRAPPPAERHEAESAPPLSNEFPTLVPQPHAVHERSR